MIPFHDEVSELTDSKNMILAIVVSAVDDDIDAQLPTCGLDVHERGDFGQRVASRDVG